jgi:hypothetical protein
MLPLLLEHKIPFSPETDCCEHEARPCTCRTTTQIAVFPDGVMLASPAEMHVAPAHTADRAPMRGAAMIKVRTFATPIKIFATMRELQDLDAQVQTFLQEEGADKVFSMSDSSTVGEGGETIGLIRAVAYRVPE